MEKATLQTITPDEVVKMTFVGFGPPEVALAKREAERKERIERVKRIKNRKARQAAQRSNVVLADLGLSKAERRAIGQRQRKSDVRKPQNYRWDPSVPTRQS